MREVVEGLFEAKPPSLDEPRTGLVPKLFARRRKALAPLVVLRDGPRVAAGPGETPGGREQKGVSAVLFLRDHCGSAEAARSGQNERCRPSRGERTHRERVRLNDLRPPHYSRQARAVRTRSCAWSRARWPRCRSL